MLQRAQAQLTEIAAGIELDTLRTRRAHLEGRRMDAGLWKDPRAAAVLLAEVDQLDRVIERMEQLAGEQVQMSETMQRSAKREELRLALEPIQRHISHVGEAHRELLRIGQDGDSDALLEIRPLGEAARAVRDLLYNTYTTWAQGRRHPVRMVREPLADDEPVMLAITGPYAYGYLAGETGHHRLRDGDHTCVARVTVVPLRGTSGQVTAVTQKALKKKGQYGGAVRARVEVAGSGLVIQTASGVPESLELAAELLPSWPGGAAGGEHAVVRRYDLEPFLLRDLRTDTTSGRPESPGTLPRAALQMD